MELKNYFAFRLELIEMNIDNKFIIFTATIIVAF